MTKFRLIPRVSTFLADTLTPVGAYQRLRRHFPRSLLLESSDYQRAENSFSYICCEPMAEVSIEHGAVCRSFPDGTREEIAIENYGVPRHLVARRVLEDFLDRFEYRPESEPAKGVVNGLFGFLAYDAVPYLEDIRLTTSPDPARSLPELRYALYRYVLAFDHFRNQLHLLENTCSEVPNKNSKNVFVLASGPEMRGEGFRVTGELESPASDVEHAALVRECQRHILRGDVFQIVPSRRFSRKYSGDDFNVYRMLRSINPSPYLFYLDGGDYRIFGSSPEAQLVVRDGFASIRPIAGTYKRTGDDTLDAQAAQNLLVDPKECAEHVMLVDLARNDLSIHCYPVEVQNFREVQIYSHVIHLVSKVSGKISPHSSPLAVLTSTFPAGTLSGAPKYKAMELIDRLEGARRHSYGGALGFIGFDGSINHAIIIRSFMSKDGVLHCQAGSGIVADSQPETEVEEVRHKLAALMRAVEGAQEIPA